jgi:ketosteroid isomerase-like protein
MDTLDQQFYDYPHFEDQITQFLEQNSEIRMFFREASTEVKGDKATVTVDGEMVYSTKAAPQREIRRQQTVEFFFQRQQKGGWKIYDINPRSFFTF